MVSGRAILLLVIFFSLVCGGGITGGNAGAMAHWVEACGFVGVVGAVVWGRHARRFRVGFTGGC